MKLGCPSHFHSIAAAHSMKVHGNLQSSSNGLLDQSVPHSKCKCILWYNCHIGDKALGINFIFRGSRGSRRNLKNNNNPEMICSLYPLPLPIQKEKLPE